MSDGGAAGPTRARTTAVVVLVAAVVGALLLVLTLTLGGGDRGQAREGRAQATQAPAGATPESGTQSSQTPQPTRQPIHTARRTGSVASERPTSVRLPSGRLVPVEAVSSTRDGVLAVPEDIRHAGWFRGGSALGDPFGSTLVAAHVDSVTQGLGPFEELLGVRAGQRVTVASRGLRQTFRIDSLRLVPQGSLAGQAWIYAPTGDRRLTLVTCAPPYVREDGGYQNLAVVTALPVGDAVPTSRAREADRP